MAREIVGWYLKYHYGTPDDPGMPAMFCNPEKVGHFAITKEEFERGDPKALFRVLVATTLFQRRQDVQVMRILKGITKEQVELLTSKEKLLSLAEELPCQHIKSNQALLELCGLDKTSKGVGCCAQNKNLDCHLKKHTMWLKRYGHFGKVPTSLAMVLKEGNWENLNELYQMALKSSPTRRGRAKLLEQHLSLAWRVNQKIASMFLSMLTNPALLEKPPWIKSIDWSYFIVIDSNIDIFLKSIKYNGGSSYDARRDFIAALARRIKLQLPGGEPVSGNPRIVQQALYLFTSSANRRALVGDCTRLDICTSCPRALASRCAFSPVLGRLAFAVE